ncbi:MAG: hypothetical protein LBR22_02040 [Desulfovibrio sp.]|jgi:flagellar biosynthesis/type III secretory pathway protein FliH|nr:hypothetical protein [Desulfovibrio sp.]
MTIQEILEEDRKACSYREDYEIAFKEDFKEGFKEGREEERKIHVIALQESPLSQLKERFKRIPRPLARQIKQSRTAACS